MLLIKLSAPSFSTQQSLFSLQGSSQRACPTLLPSSPPPLPNPNSNPLSLLPALTAAQGSALPVYLHCTVLHYAAAHAIPLKLLPSSLTPHCRLNQVRASKPGTEKPSGEKSEAIHETSKIKIVEPNNNDKSQHRRRIFTRSNVTLLSSSVPAKQAFLSHIGRADGRIHLTVRTTRVSRPYSSVRYRQLHVQFLLPRTRTRTRTSYRDLQHSSVGATRIQQASCPVVSRPSRVCCLPRIPSHPSIKSRTYIHTYIHCSTAPHSKPASDSSTIEYCRYRERKCWNILGIQTRAQVRLVNKSPIFRDPGNKPTWRTRMVVDTVRSFISYCLNSHCMNRILWKF